VLFTMVGSLLMLVAIIYLVLSAREHFHRLSFDLPLLYQVPLTESEARWLFAAFALAFAIKVPMWPVHTWLPDAHTEAPTAGSVILAGIMLKMGTYGFLRFAIPLFPGVAVEAVPLCLALAVIGSSRSTRRAWRAPSTRCSITAFPPARCSCWWE
jgi:NADH-quinone oxidoreductase subunit M